MTIDQYVEQIANSKENTLAAVEYYLDLFEILNEICKISDKLTPDEVLELAKLPDDVLSQEVLPLIINLLDRKHRLEKAILILSKAKQKIKTRQPLQEHSACLHHEAI